MRVNPIKRASQGPDKWMFTCRQPQIAGVCISWDFEGFQKQEVCVCAAGVIILET